MNALSKYILSLCVFCIAVIVVLSVKPAFAAEVDSTATCAVSVTVSPVMEWAGNFATGISLTAINAYTDAPTGNDNQTIYTNCNFTIGADQTATAQLANATDTLITNYRMTEDGDAVASTGATDGQCTTSGLDSYALYSSFLTTVLPILHINTDGAVVITLYCTNVQYNVI